MASTSLSRNTWGTATNDKIFTMSVWVKRSGLGYQQIVNSYDGSTGNDNQLKFQSTDAIELTVSTGTEYFLKTNRLFRDVSAWYHIVFAFDSTQATDSDRYKLYVNGTQETSFSSVSYPPQNTTYQFFRNSNANNIGSQFGASGGFFNGSMTHFHFIDGTAYDASAFGETDATTGIWKPKTAPSVTYGTNGFFLKFENSGSMGTDSSGNANNFTVNGTLTQTVDTPSNVFCTWNAIFPTASSSASNTLSNGNLTMSNTADAFGSEVGTLAVSKGKWYWETKLVSGVDTKPYIGIAKVTDSFVYVGQSANSYGYMGEVGRRYNNSTQTSYGSAASNGDIFMVAFDADNGTIWVGKNGTWFDSATQTEIENGTTTNAMYSGITIDDYFTPAGTVEDCTLHANFGNGYFGTTAVSSAQNPDDGIGIFEYSVPTGYRALCTKSINAEEYS